MRRWWRTTGALLIILWLVAALFLNAFANAMITLHIPVRWMLQIMSFRQHLSWLIVAVFECALPLIWLLAAWAWYRSYRRIFDSVAAPMGKLAPGRLYNVLLLQGWPLVLLALPVGVFAALMQRMVNDGPLGFGPRVGLPSNASAESWSVQYFLNNEFSSLIGDLVLVLLLVALLVAARRLRYSGLLLFLVKLGSVTNFIRLPGTTPAGGMQPLLPWDTLDTASYISLAMLLVLLVAFVRDSRLLFWSGMWLVFVGSVASAMQRVFIAGNDPVLPLSVRYPLLVLANGIEMLFLRGPVWIGPNKPGAPSIPDPHKMIVYPLLQERFGIGDAWRAFVVALLIGLAWLALIYGISYLCVSRTKLQLGPGEA